MKEFFQGVWALIWATIVSCLMITIGTVYSLGYSIWLTITLKKWYAFFIFWWRLIDGIFFALGHMLYELAYSLDLIWNVNGEILEDFMTAEENTTFTDRDISVSASVGKLQKEGKLNRFGLWFSRLLNFAFGQKQHALDAWEYTQAKKALREKYFKKETDKKF